MKQKVIFTYTGVPCVPGPGDTPLRVFIRTSIYIMYLLCFKMKRKFYIYLYQIISTKYLLYGSKIY